MSHQLSATNRAKALTVFIALFLFALNAQVSMARAMGCDEGVDPKLFQDNDWKGDKDKKPPHRLIAPPCEGCKSLFDDLQRALDDCYALDLKDAEKRLGDSIPPSENDQKRLKARAKADLDALGNPADGGKAAKAQQEKDASDKTKKDTHWGQKKLQKHIKKLAGDIAEHLKTCPNAQGGNTAPPANPGTPPPDNGTPNTPGTPNNPGTPENPTPKAPKPAPEHVLKIDFVINRGATLDSEGAGNETPAQEDQEIDDYLDKVNEAFAGSGIGFKRNSTTRVNDPDRPEYPEAGGENKASKEQTDVAKEAEAEAKKLKEKGDITVKIVHNFHDTDKPTNSPASIQGITIGRTIIIVDPWDVKRNTLGGEEWNHTMAHELGHRLGLDHTVLPSDTDYTNQENGVYKEPNIMAPNHPRTTEPDEFTPDQIAVMKKYYQIEFGTGTNAPLNGGGGTTPGTGTNAPGSGGGTPGPGGAPGKLKNDRASLPPNALPSSENISAPNDLFRTGELALNVFGLGGLGHGDDTVTEIHEEDRIEPIDETSGQTQMITKIGHGGITTKRVPVKIRTTMNTAPIQGSFGGAGFDGMYFVTRNVGLGLTGEWLDGEGSLGAVMATGEFRYPMGHTAPYLYGGAGALFDGGTEAAGTAGAGLEYRFSRHFGVFVDAGGLFSEHENAAVFRAGVSIAY